MGAIYPDLEGKVVLVTGGGSGIGDAIVRGFAGQKARVAFVDIAIGPSRALAKSLTDSGTPVHFEPCDLTDLGALRSAIGAVRSRLGAVQVLINNAGHDERHPT